MKQGSGDRLSKSFIQERSKERKENRVAFPAFCMQGPSSDWACSGTRRPPADSRGCLEAQLRAATADVITSDYPGMAISRDSSLMSFQLEWKRGRATWRRIIPAQGARRIPPLLGVYSCETRLNVSSVSLASFSSSESFSQPRETDWVGLRVRGCRTW